MQLDEFVLDNWYLFAALVVILALLARSYIGAARIRSASPLEAVRLMNHAEALVLDVRTDKEFAEGHMANAVHIPLGLLQSRLNEISEHKERDIVVVCRSGARSAQACETLGKQGFAKATNLSGGMMAWENAGLPVVSAASKGKKRS